MFINTNKTDERSLLEQHEGYWDYHAKQVHSTALPCARARACTFFYCITLNLYTSFYFVTTDLVATKFMYIDSASHGAERPMLHVCISGCGLLSSSSNLLQMSPHTKSHYEESSCLK